MFVDEFYKFCQFACKKANNGNITPDEFNRAYAMASNQLFIQRYGLPEDYQPGKASPKIAYEISQKIEDDFAPFLKEVPLQIDVNGQAPRPVDYSHYIVISKNVKIFNKYCGAKAVLNYLPTSIDVLTGSQLPVRRASQVLPPTSTSPICKFYSNFIQFFPQDIKSAVIMYLANPVNAVWAFVTPDGRTPQFDPTNSVEVPWPVDTHFDLKVRILQFFGINLGMNNIYEITEKMKNEGQ
jgi:hypothetical protein